METVEYMLDGIGRARIGNKALTSDGPALPPGRTECSEDSVNILHAGRFWDIQVRPV
ncbi:hypothetical protein WMF38_43290 [Sorangium sp. So ce118]